MTKNVYIIYLITVPYSKTSINSNFQYKNSEKSIFIPATTSKYPINDMKVSSVEPDCEEKPIGFVAEWINTYLFLERKWIVSSQIIQ